MTDPHQRNRHNPAWQAAQQWRERARQTRPSSRAGGGLRLLFTWLLFGILMIVGTVVGLLFLLIGWAMLPFLRYRMKKQMERMRAEQATDVGGDFHHHNTQHSSRDQQVLEGDYEVKNDRSSR